MSVTRASRAAVCAELPSSEAEASTAPEESDSKAKSQRGRVALRRRSKEPACVHRESDALYMQHDTGALSVSSDVVADPGPELSEVKVDVTSDSGPPGASPPSESMRESSEAAASIQDVPVAIREAYPCDQATLKRGVSRGVVISF